MTERKFRTPQEAVNAILDTVAMVRNMVGYTGASGDDAADVWVGPSLHAIEDAALFLSLSALRIPDTGCCSKCGAPESAMVITTPR